MAVNVLTGDLTFKSLLPCDLSTCTKKDIFEYFENSYNLNESLFTALNGEQVFYLRPDRLRLPLIFYYGHTACVYINKLILAGLIKPEDRVNLAFETIFETGVDEMSWDDVENYRMGGKLQWPELADVVEYRATVRKLIHRIIEDTPLQLPITPESPWWGLFMGMEHERIHLETSSVLIRQLPLGFVTRPEGWIYAPFKSETPVTDNPMIPIAGGELTLGKPADFPSYGWDDEYGSLYCKVPQFEASKYLVSNREYLQFIRDGGYQEESHWTDEGWQWKQFRQAIHPTFWVCEKSCRSGCGGPLAAFTHCKPERRLANGQNSYCNGHEVVDGNGHQGKDEGGGYSQQYRLRCMFDVVAMPWDWPVEVNFHEAKAFCVWKGPEYRLPIEAEHCCMKGVQLKLPSNSTDCDIIFNKDPGANFNMHFGSSSPVNMFPASCHGLHDVCGNVWQWMEDHMNGLPGFQTMPYYDDFTLPVLDGRHNVIMGGSWVSTGDSASRFGRYAFRRHFFQHLGFRLARSVADTDHKVELPVNYIKTKVYVLGAGIADNPPAIDTACYTYITSDSSNQQYCSDTAESAQQMMSVEYAGDTSVAAQLARISVRLVADMGIGRDRALHIGCATGRVTFSLASHFDEVIGQDFSAYFIEACQKIQAYNNDGSTFEMANENVNDYLKTVNGIQSNLTFKQLTWLPNEVGFYDFVLVTGLERLQNPKGWFLRLPEIVRPRGLLIVSARVQHQKLVLTELANRFRLAQSVDIPLPVSTSVTVWQHK